MCFEGGEIRIKIKKKTVYFLNLLYSKQTTFWQRICRSPPHRLLCIIVRAAKLPEGKKIKLKSATISKNFESILLHALNPLTLSQWSGELVTTSHRSGLTERERGKFLPPLVLGEDSNLRLAALSHVATWMEIFCASSRTALTGRFIMWGSAARGPPQTPAAAWASSGARLSGGAQRNARAAPWFVESLSVCGWPP